MGPFLALVGSTLTLFAALGVVRFPGVLARMHALTKASTTGLVLVLLGGALTLTNVNDITSLLLAGALQILTMPVGANLMSRATYLASEIPSHVDTVDELAERMARLDDGVDDDLDGISHDLDDDRPDDVGGIDVLDRDGGDDGGDRGHRGTTPGHP